MIEVVANWGDRVEAEDAESAFAAARTLWDEALLARTAGNRPSLSFYVDGEFVETTLDRVQFGRAA